MVSTHQQCSSKGGVMEDKFTLYSYWRSSCSWRIRIALNLKGIPFEYKAVNLLKQEQRSQEYLALNPAGLVPTLVIDKADGNRIILNQSTAILEYLEEAYPATRRLLPADPLQRARARAIYMTIACDVQPLQNLRVLQTMEEPAKTEWGHKAVSQGLSTIEKLLKDTTGKYCVGDQVTLADIAIIPQLNRFGVNTDDYPTIAAISKRLEALPEFIAADGPNQPDHPSKHQT